MNRTVTSVLLIIALGSPSMSSSLCAQSSLDTPLTRLRPIGSPSAVDKYRAPAVTQRFHQTAYQGGAQVRHADFIDNSGNRASVQPSQFTAPPIPNSLGSSGSIGAPQSSESPFSVLETAPPTDFPTSPTPSTALPSTALPSTGVPSTSLPPSAATAQPRGLPFGSGNLAPVPLDAPGAISSSGDLAPLAQPQLTNGFATIDNCCCVSPPSNYVAATGWGTCTPVAYQPTVTYEAPPTYPAQPPVIAAPTVIPPSIPPRGSGIPRGPLISFGQDRNPVQIGQGVVGQPVAYVPGQPIRNWIRYFFP